TTIKVQLPFAGDVFVEVFNVAGQQVYAQTYHGFGAGNNQVTLDLSNVESGVYFYKVKFDDHYLVNKMVIR
ncbi:MAG: T9SS type A sorting domain-containing protein, partial [Bacteroidales bacterium]|nr:T9SS type A sorting domain-containing protein [Bacteroidales bacterium]